ncbi:MAG: RecX family transcriptional regulator [Tannerellaceae bacterium]|jgi:regulatory protein|nr:RecX family transcriptional regulator [Tannerellaceae bacterium]
MRILEESEMQHRMAAYCSSGERCKQDVEKKLSTAGLSSDACERILTRLIEERFIDELRYTRSFINDKLRFNGWGRIRIKWELKRKNIPQEIIFEAMRNMDEAAYITVLADLLASKKKSLRGKDEKDVYIKLQRFAVGRGFEYDEITKCLLQLFDGRRYEDNEDTSTGDYDKDI